MLIGHAHSLVKSCRSTKLEGRKLLILGDLQAHVFKEQRLSLPLPTIEDARQRLASSTSALHVEASGLLWTTITRRRANIPDGMPCRALRSALDFRKDLFYAGDCKAKYAFAAKNMRLNVAICTRQS